MTRSEIPPVNIATLWILTFGWISFLGAILFRNGLLWVFRFLTMDNLQRNIVIVNACPMCLEDAESVDHLLLASKHADFIWKSNFSWFDFNGRLPSNPCSLLQLSESW